MIVKYTYPYGVQCSTLQRSLRLFSCVLILCYGTLTLLYGQRIPLENLSYPARQNPEWNFLGKAIGDHPIVCLGEESHWIETYLEVKNGMIKYLHQQEHFQALLVESGFIQAFMAIQEDLSGKARMQEAWYTIWQTEATYDLIQYLDQTSEESNSLILLGFDLKGPKSFRFSQYIKRVFEAVDQSFAEEMRELDSAFVEMRFEWEPEIGKAYSGVYLSEEEYIRYKKAYEKAIQAVGVYQNQLELDDSTQAYFIQCLQNRLYLLELMQIPTYQEKHRHRDAKMAENIHWLLNQVVPEKKAMIWGADIHISKDAIWEQMGTEWEVNRSVIEVLEQLTDQPIYSIGIKPAKQLPKKCRKILFDKGDSFVFSTADDPCLSKWKTEHDAIIFCKKTKGIKKYQVQ